MNHELIVHLQEPPQPSGAVSFDRPLDRFPVFDLESGRNVRRFEWRQEGKIACWQQSRLVFLANQWDTFTPSHLAVLQAEPKGPPAQRQRSDAPISFQIKRVVECQADMASTRLRDDEGARSYCFYRRQAIDENDIAAASPYADWLGLPGLRLRLTDAGAEKIRALTAGLQGPMHFGLVIDAVSDNGYSVNDEIAQECQGFVTSRPRRTAKAFNLVPPNPLLQHPAWCYNPAHGVSRTTGTSPTGSP